MVDVSPVTAHGLISSLECQGTDRQTATFMFECTALTIINYTDNKDSLSTRDAGTGRL